MPDAEFVRDAFARIADRYVMTNHVLSAGTDILWRRKVGRLVKPWNPQKILDVASGTGDLALELQKVCPEAELLATDFCAEMLSHASSRGVEKTQVADALKLPFEDEQYDLTTVAFGLRNMSDLNKGLREMGRVTKTGGRLLVLDFSLPKGTLGKVYAQYLNHVLPKLAGFLTGQPDAYEYLAESIEAFPSGAQMIERFEQTGYEQVKWIPLSFGIASIYIGIKK